MKVKSLAIFHSIQDFPILNPDLEFPLQQRLDDTKNEDTSPSFHVLSSLQKQLFYHQKLHPLYREKEYVYKSQNSVCSSCLF